MLGDIRKKKEQDEDSTVKRPAANPSWRERIQGAQVPIRYGANGCNPRREARQEQRTPSTEFEGKAIETAVQSRSGLRW